MYIYMYIYIYILCIYIIPILIHLSIILSVVEVPSKEIKQLFFYSSFMLSWCNWSPK